MAIAFVNSVSATASVVTSVTTSAISITGGNTIIVGAVNSPQSNGAYEDAVTPITDSSGANTYTKIGTSPLSGLRYCELFYAKNVTGGSLTFTYTITASSHPRILVMQFSGLSTTAPLDQGAAGSFAFTFNNSTSTTPSITTTSASELLVAVEAYGNCSSTTHTWGDGGCTNNSGAWATPETIADTTCTDASVGYAIVSGTGTYCATCTYGAGGFDDSAGIASLVAAGVATIPPGLGPVVQMEQMFHLDASLMR